MLVTGLLNVPWEALYNPDDPGGGFLSDRCSIITRWPEQTGNAERDLVTTPTVFGRPRIVCLDSVLAGDPQAMEGTSLIATLREEGEHVHMPISRSELVKSVSDVRMVHWICELQNAVFGSLRKSFIQRMMRSPIGFLAVRL